MATYAIGDLQGCYDPLQRLLEKLRFDPSRDQLWFCGDLVNRGGQSLEVLRLVRSLDSVSLVVLGNHDLALLSIAERSADDQRRVNPDLRRVLEAPDAQELLKWLRFRPLLHADQTLNFALVHAGLAPKWTIKTAARRAREIEHKLRGHGYKKLFRRMYGDKPATWSQKLEGAERQRVIINVMTRMRYCDKRGRMLLGHKGPPGTQPDGYYPWFEVPGKVEREYRVVCGHWSSLGLFQGLGVYAIDTGCVWGGPLTALELGPEPRVIQVKGNANPPSHKDA